MVRQLRFGVSSRIPSRPCKSSVANASEHGHVVVAVVDGEFTVKRLWKRGTNLKLQAANPTYPDILPKDGQTVEVWGVVTTAIKAMQK